MPAMGASDAYLVSYCKQPTGLQIKQSASGRYERRDSRTVAFRVSDDTLKALRHIGAERDMTVSTLLRTLAERLVSEAPELR
jgi:hypothetical protein